MSKLPLMALSQIYLEQLLSIPPEIKQDLLYCQRALRAHIKIHQMVHEVFQQQDDGLLPLQDPKQRKTIIENLEEQIHEINAEQNYLFIRVKRIVEEFNKLLKQNNMKRTVNATHVIQSVLEKEVIPFTNDDVDIDMQPHFVQPRYTEKQLIERYFEMYQEKEVYEVYDSDDDAVMIIDDSHMNGAIKPDPIKKLINTTTTNVNSNQSQSLLKPIAERLAADPNFNDASQYLQIDITEEHLPKKEDEKFELPVSKKVTMSRMNLRQALKKARTDNMAAAAAKAAANMIRPTTTDTSAIPATQTIVTQKPSTSIPATVVKPSTSGQLRNVVAAQQVTSKKVETKSKSTRAVNPAKSSDLNTSSEDSNNARSRSITPPQALSPTFAEENTKTLPEHCTQDEFLHYFTLVTLEGYGHMQQRRSKRKRRSVHSNERADFHYGRIDCGKESNSTKEPKKKRETFLLSPQTKRGLQQGKRAKTSAEKADEPSSSRSASNSPNDKRCCTECLKGGGPFEECCECKGYYHQSCHYEEDKGKYSNTNKRQRVMEGNEVKKCPDCKKGLIKMLQKGAESRKTLQELEIKATLQEERRNSLQEKSKMFKISMHDLFDAVNVVK